MTAVAIFRLAGRVHVATDTAALAPDGRLVHRTTKFVVMPHARSVMVCRGSPLQGTIAAGALTECPDIDALGARGSENLREVFCAPAPELRKAFTANGTNGEAEIVISGLARDNEPVTYMMRSQWDGQRMTWHSDVARGDGITLGPSTDIVPEFVEHLRQNGRQAGDMMLELPWLMHRCRQVLSPFNGLPGVGGEVLLTTISADLMATRQVMRWDDTLGEPLDPGASYTADTGALVRVTRAGRLNVPCGGQRERQGEGVFGALGAR